MLVTHRSVEISYFFTDVLWGFLVVGFVLVCFFPSFFFPALYHLGKPAKFRSDTAQLLCMESCRHQLNSPAFSGEWLCHLYWKLNSSFSNHNFSCYFQKYLWVKAKLPKACERNEHFMMAKGPTNLQEKVCRERPSPTRQWVSQTGQGEGR